MTILVVEDDVRVAELLCRALNDQKIDTHVAYDGFSALKLIAQNHYDLVITDVVLPKIDGIEFCQKSKVIKPDMPILMLSALGTTDNKIEGFDAGADDYLVKPFEMRELLARIHVLFKRNAQNRSTTGFILRFEDLEMNVHTKVVKRSGVDIHLTPKEFHLLKYLLENPQRVLSRVEIAEKVWDTHFDTGTNFIDVYINYLRKKIDKNFDKKLIHTKSGMGFILKTSDR